MTTKELSLKQPVLLTGILALSLMLATSNLLIQPALASVTYDVTILDFSFNPQVRCIEKRDNITWTNSDQVIYMLWFVFDENGSTYLLSDPILPGETWTYNFTEPTKLLYYDLDKLWITGKIRIYTIFGDVNWDRIVDGFDFSLMGAAYRATPGDLNWNEDCDINGDDIVDGFDFSIAGGNYRKVDP